MNDGTVILHTSPDDLLRWKHYYDRLARKNIYSSPDYIRLLEKQWGDEAELFICGDEESYVYYPYFKRRIDTRVLDGEDHRDLSPYRDIVSSWYYGGPLFSAEQDDPLLARGFIEQFYAHAVRSGFVSGFVRFDPNIGNHAVYQGLMDVERNRETVCIDLQRPSEDIFRGFGATNRRNIRRAEREGISVTVTDAESDWHEFASIYAQEMMRKNAPAHLCLPSTFFHLMRCDLRGHCTLVKALDRGRTVGGLIVLYDEQCAYHYLSASDPAYWGKRVNNLLFSGAVLFAKRMEIPTFDFMGGRPGVFRFKAQFSRQRRSFFVAKTVYDRDLFDTLCRRSSMHNAQYFPPYRADA